MARIVLVFVTISSVLLLAACAGTETPTSAPTSLPTPAPTVTAGIMIQGYVRLNSAEGAGLADVQIYAKGGYGSTEGPARLLATTDADGYYWNGNAIPGMVVWAELEGYVFEPASWNYMGEGQSCTDACDFIARPAP